MPLHTEIEINSSPEEVRKIFLDFPAYPTWTSGFIHSITPHDPSAIVPGSKLTAALEGMTITTTLLANNATEFRWRGMLWGIPGLFTGEHFFRFEESGSGSASGGGKKCRFVHGEDFSGVLALLLMREGTGFWKKTKGGFEGFNADLKRRCEEGVRK